MHIFDPAPLDKQLERARAEFQRTLEGPGKRLLFRIQECRLSRLYSNFVRQRESFIRASTVEKSDPFWIGNFDE
jgi:hypothetical protein